MGKVVLFLAQVVAVAAITYAEYAATAFSRFYFPKSPPNIWRDVEFAALVSLVWIAPNVLAWVWSRVRRVT